MRNLSASEFKAKCLAILDEVANTGEPVSITKRGRPVAQLFPAVAVEDRYPQYALRGTVRIVSDIVEPTTLPEDWLAERGEL